MLEIILKVKYHPSEDAQLKSLRIITPSNKEEVANDLFNQVSKLIKEGGDTTFEVLVKSYNFKEPLIGELSFTPLVLTKMALEYKDLEEIGLDDWIFNLLVDTINLEIFELGTYKLNTLEPIKN